jgi:hypothetical protein
MKRPINQLRGLAEVARLAAELDALRERDPAAYERAMAEVRERLGLTPALRDVIDAMIAEITPRLTALAWYWLIDDPRAAEMTRVVFEDAKGAIHDRK